MKTSRPESRAAWSEPDRSVPLPAVTSGLEHQPAAPPAGTRGEQRLSVAALRRWEAMRFGMFVCYGLNTYVGAEMPNGQDPATRYAPDRLDVDQWVCVARDAGMKYAILTTKHISGHCLWPSRHTDYHVGFSGNQTDVVAAFMAACARRGVKPGFYYSSWDNHHRFGSLSANIAPQPLEPSGPPANRSSAYVTQAYLDFQWDQITELMENYGPVAEWWIDIPHLLPRDYRNRLYAHIAARQPQTVILNNHGIGDGSEVLMDRAWPTDLMTIERFLPNSVTGHRKWRLLDGRYYYLPGEVCDPIGNAWFYTEKDRPRSDAELLGMYLTSTSRGANLLLAVGPDKHGQIPRRAVSALMRLRRKHNMNLRYSIDWMRHAVILTAEDLLSGTELSLAAFEMSTVSMVFQDGRSLVDFSAVTQVDARTDDLVYLLISLNKLARSRTAVVLPSGNTSDPIVEAIRAAGLRHVRSFQGEAEALGWLNESAAPEQLLAAKPKPEP